METKFDLIVVGGGMAGVGAAISAAREGMKVLLVDRNNCLGGASMESLVNPFMAHWTYEPVTEKRIYLAKGIFAEIVEKLKANNAMEEYGRVFDEEYLKLLLNRMAIDAGVKLLFNSYVTEAEAEDGVVKNITVFNKSGKTVYYADYFVDATGDGDLSFMVGCEYRLGRDSDNLCQPMTLCFRVAGVDSEKFYKEKPLMQKLYKQYREEGKIKNVREDILTFPTMVKDIIHFNSTRVVKKNPVNAEDLTESELITREQSYELVEFLRENFESFKNARIISSALRIGVRESRKIMGEYLLTVEDLKACTKFEDGVVACNYAIDIHNPEGAGTTYIGFKHGEYYTIPYRCLTPKGTKNLLVAGRCISSTHEAQASYRIMPSCTCMGQAVGIAASIASKNKVGVKEIDVQALRQRIRECGGLVD